MQKKFGFILLTPDEFDGWIVQQRVARTILYLQQHHTWTPSYIHFREDNHFELQRSMQHFHKNVNGWLDIGQHFTIFPDGCVVTGRNLELSPACIFGFNAHAICIENLGNFDEGKDTMRLEQRNAIVRVTAALCNRFNIPATTERIVYHHWFDLSTGNRTNGSGITKSCPGTAFFGGNKVVDAEVNFLPLVREYLHSGHVPPPVLKYGYVTAEWLTIRNQPSVRGRKMNVTPFGSVLRIYAEKNNWYRISATKEEWVSAQFVRDAKRAVVINTDTLNVRSGPSTQFDVIGTLSRNDEVFLFEEKGNWAKIGVDDRWVSKAYLRIYA
ncbi:MAG: amidase [Saprospiraceae bacterium]|nr:amidase [Saprospiraceae bacterium]MDW8484782.1 SH3 domain-containing protein [Saprospiraceae bacterium]